MNAGMSLRLPSHWKPVLMKGAITALDRTGVFRLLAPKWQGVGVIFTLHHVQSGEHHSFSPNRILSITPEYLESVISQLKSMSYDIVSLSEACRRLREGDFSKRFASFTLDDGYQDNFDVALPVFEKHDVPFTVYIATSMPDGTAVLWWDLLEQVIREHDLVSCQLNGEHLDLDCSSVSRKYAAFDTIYSALRPMDSEAQSRFLNEFFERHSVDALAYTRSQAMDWETLKELSSHPLCEIGAHTLTHPRMSGLDKETLLREVSDSQQRLKKELNVPINHFAYPFGDPSSAAGREFALLKGMEFESSVTTRKGVLFEEHAEHMSALPRVSLNGDFQTTRYTKLFIEGGPFALSNRFQRLNVN